jgi:hypothetical protein
MDRLLMFHASYCTLHHALHHVALSSYMLIYVRSHRADGRGADGASTSGGVRYPGTN